MRKRAIHVSESEAANDFRSVLARVQVGEPDVRLLSESLRLAKEHGSNATLDGDFGRDLQEVVSGHREPLKPPT